MSSDDPVIYLDHAATTPVDPDVFRAMAPYFTAGFGNPSSIYQVGQAARSALDDARAKISRVLGCHPSEIVFTSGATESNNLALKGVAWAARLRSPDGPPPHIVTTAIEHHAVLHAAEALERQGFTVSYVGSDAQGVVDPGEVAGAIRPETCLIAVMYANNEVGSIQPVAEICRAGRANGIPVHTDAVQAAGALSLNVDGIGVDLLALSAHKFYGPKGVGLLYVRKGTPIWFQQHGGGQESGRRGGTENVPLIVGMAEALIRADANREHANALARAMRDQLWARIVGEISQVTLNGPDLDGPRLPNNLNVSLPGLQGETALLSLDMAGVAASAGSACTTGNSEPSHVLRAMGLSEDACRASLRFTVGRLNTAEQIDDAADALVETVNRMALLSGAR